MKKALMLSAMALVLGATSAQAKKIGKSYTFGTAGGGAYCDGMTGISGTTIVTAVHNYAACGYPSTANGLLGGYESTVASLGSGTFYPMINSPGSYGSPYFDLLYSVNFGTLTFDAAYESAEYGYPFYQYITGGTLIKKYNKAVREKGHIESTVTAALKSAKLLKK
jgi:hypothetical protein